MTGEDLLRVQYAIEKATATSAARTAEEMRWVSKAIEVARESDPSAGLTLLTFAQMMLKERAA